MQSLNAHARQNRSLKTRALASASVSLPALIVFLAASPASAQMTFCNTDNCKNIQTADEVNALSVFSTLPNTPEGRELLRQNAAVTTNIYANSTVEQRVLAGENALGDITAHLWGMTNTPISNQMVDWGLNGTLPNTIAIDLWNTGTLLRSGRVKDYYAAQGIYATAYGAGYEVGNPRPFIALPAIGNNPWTTATSPASAVNAQHEEWSENVTEASFASGHSMRGFMTALYYGMQLPTYSQDLFASSQQYGLSRNVLGMHYSLDVIGGRIIALQTLSHAMANDPNYSSNYTTAFEANRQALTAALGAGAVSPLNNACGADLKACMTSGVVPSAAALREARATSTWYLTYGLPSIGDTTLAPVVPENAELLFRSRFPYLSDAQIRDVIASTELPSGVPLDNGSGWARVNPYAANGGYGAFTSTVTVNMDASKGSLSAFDIWSNDISGPGGLVKQGTGALLLAGDNTYSGGTSVQQGTVGLTGTLTGNLDISSGAAFISTGGYSVAPNAVLNNAGTFTSLNSTLRNFGTATNTGLVEGDVSNFGRLTGTGRVAGNLNNAGILQPGASIGTMSVSGNATFANTSTYLVQTDSTGASSQLAVGGSAALDGKLVMVSTNGGFAHLGNYNVLTAQQGISGNFASVSALAPFLSASASVSGRNLTVSVAPNVAALSVAGGTPNANAVGRAIAYLPYSSPVLQSTVMLDTGSAPHVLANLTGEIHASTASVLQSQSAHLRQAIIGRLHNDKPAETGAPAAGPAPQSLTAWGQGFGGWGSLNGSAGVSGVTSSMAGFLTGFESEVLPGWRVGIAGGYNRTSYSTDDISGDGDSDNYDLSLYGANSFGNITLRYAGSYTWHDISTSRTSFLPGLAGNLTAGQNGSTAQAFGEIGYKLKIAGGHEIEPFAGVAYSRLKLDGFTERGNMAALASGGLTQDNVMSTLGLRASHDFTAGSAKFAIRGSIAWQHTFGDIKPLLTERFAFSNGPAFSITGAPIARDAALVDVSADWLINENARLGVSYTGQLSSEAQNNAIQGRFTINF